MPGVAMALVSNAKDPLKLGRVRLRFPWLSDTYESDWCRVAQLGGVRGGGLILPEVGDEVLCAFDRGSLEHPYVLAGLYNGIDKPTPQTDGLPAVDPTSGRVNWRSIASRSGHTVELVDAKSRMKSGIRLQTGNGKLTVHMDETRTQVTIRSDGSVSITGTRNVSIKAGGNLSLIAGGSLTMSAAWGGRHQGGREVRRRGGRRGGHQRDRRHQPQVGRRGGRQLGRGGLRLRGRRGGRQRGRRGSHQLALPRSR